MIRSFVEHSSILDDGLTDGNIENCYEKAEHNKGRDFTKENMHKYMYTQNCMENTTLLTTVAICSESIMKICENHQKPSND